MKHTTINLVKFRRLQHECGLPFYQCVGLLESLWLFAQTNAIDGCLDKYEIEDICAWMGCDRDHLSALDKAGWLDNHDGVLMIHDWGDHAPNWVKGVLSKRPGPAPSSAPGPAPKCATNSVNKPNLTQPNLTQPKERAATAAQSPPTLEEVKGYAEQIGYPLDAGEFIDTYETNGWKTRNGRPIKSWQAAVRTWKRKGWGRATSGNGKPETTPEAKQRIARRRAAYQIWDQTKGQEEPERIAALAAKGLSMDDLGGEWDA